MTKKKKKANFDAIIFIYVKYTYSCIVSLWLFRIFIMKRWREMDKQ